MSNLLDKIIDNYFANMLGKEIIRNLGIYKKKKKICYKK